MKGRRRTPALGGIVACELEEDRDHVDGEEDCSAACRGHSEEDEDCTKFEEFDGEDPTRCGGQSGVYLLDSENNKENARADEEANDISAVPWVGDSTERNGQDSRDESTEGKNGSKVIYLTCAVYEGTPGRGSLLGSIKR